MVVYFRLHFYLQDYLLIMYQIAGDRDSLTKIKWEYTTLYENAAY